MGSRDFAERDGSGGLAHKLWQTCISRKDASLGLSMFLRNF